MFCCALGHNNHELQRLLECWWRPCLVSRTRLRAEQYGRIGPLSGPVTGVNPKLSHQHPRGLLSLKCARTHTHCSLGENGKWRAGVGGEVRMQAGCGRRGCLLWALIPSAGFGTAPRMTAHGTFFISRSSWYICFANMCSGFRNDLEAFTFCRLSAVHQILNR